MTNLHIIYSGFSCCMSSIFLSNISGLAIVCWLLDVDLCDQLYPLKFWFFSPKLATVFCLQVRLKRRIQMRRGYGEPWTKLCTLPAFFGLSTHSFKFVLYYCKLSSFIILLCIYILIKSNLPYLPVILLSRWPLNFISIWFVGFIHFVCKICSNLPCYSFIGNVSYCSL